MRLLADQKPFDEVQAYAYLRKVVCIMHRTGRIRTEAYGIENLPEEGGYIIYPNHQGKYDGYAIVSAHKRPCSVVMDKSRSEFPFIREVIDIVKGKRMVPDDLRQSLTVINEVGHEVAQGRRYIIFPEGGYTKEKKNTLSEFKAGCFKASLKSKTPIVPAVLVDTYKALNGCNFRTVRPRVYFLEPIAYEVYKDMKTKEIAQMVYDRIQNKLTELAL